MVRRAEQLMNLGKRAQVLGSIAATLLMSSAASAAVAAAQPEPVNAPAPPPTIAEIVQTPAEALAQDAAEYARLYDVPLDQAVRRLRAQQESVAATDRIQASYRDRLAGIFIEHRPDYRMIVLLTGDEPVAGTSVNAGGMTVPIEFRTGAPASRDRLLAAIGDHQKEIRSALPHPPALAADPRTGELVVMTYGNDADRYPPGVLEARLAAIAGVPVRIRPLDRAGSNLSILGGSRVVGPDPADGKRHACTTGFIVTDGSRTGVVTAAHCPDSLTYVGPDRREIPLRFVGQWGWGYQDVQIHVADEVPKPLFYADSGKSAVRPVTSWRNRTATRAGDFVCHRGESTGYSCAEVELVDFAPAGDQCGGDCLPTWVTVAGPTCKHGDSGAPVFSGTIAFGIVKGATIRGDGTCLFYYYMSTDYLPPGWSLLHQ
jgi:streptogrisin C